MRIGIVQMASTEDKRENLRKATYFINKAIQEGADLIVLPEFFNYLSGKMIKEEYIKNAETMNGPTIDTLKEIAKSKNVMIIAGSITELDDGSLYNTSFAITNQGILGRYRKVHLFKYNQIDEATVFKPGDKAEVIAWNGLKIGLTICFDLRFPEIFRTEALMGAKLIINVAAFLEETGRAHWMPLLKARAIENQVFLVAANQATVRSRECAYYGHSCIIDPWGKTVTKGLGEECLLLGDIELERVEEVRRKMPLFDMRR
ncbi:MAG: carbon-nitrogen hydrolase family protein [Candidatus Methanomethylicaceae archaeon]